MKFIYFIVVTCLLILSCETTPKKQNTTEGQIPKEVSLPELSQGETVEFEDSFCRIVNQDDENEMFNKLKIQAKKEGIASFELASDNEYVSLEKVDNHFLLVSLGTGGTRDLKAYNLKTGEKILEASSSVWGIETGEESGVFYIYLYGEETPPGIYWEEATKTWKSNTEIPENLMNDQLEQQKKEFEKVGFLTDGFPIICLEKYKFDINQRKVSGTGEYRWDYAQ